MRYAFWFPVVALSGCGRADRPGPATTTVDSAGIQIVTSPGTDRPVAWNLRQVFLIGGADSGAASFTKAHPNGIAAAGGMFHLVNDDKQIVTFDSLGRSLRTVGRAGGGPGELQFPGAITAESDGSVGVFDYGKQGFVRFGADGSVVPIWSLRALGQPWRWIKVRGDSIVITTQAVDSGGVSTISLKVAGPTDTVALTSNRQGGKAGMVDLGCVKLGGQPPIFSPGMAFDWNGREIAVAQRAEYEVSVYAGTKLTRLIRRTIAPSAATTEMVSRLYPDGYKISFGDGGPPPCHVTAVDYAARMGMAATVPVIDEVRFAPDGMLWVRRYAFPKEANRYDIFAADGSYQGTLTAAGPVAGFPTNTIALMVLPDSATGGSQIAGYRIERR